MIEVLGLDAANLASVLSALLDRPCRATLRGRRPPPDAWVRGRYVDDAGEEVAVVVSNVEFAAFCAAAIAMLPVTGAEDAIETRALTESMRDAYGEVLNVLSRLFNARARGHCRWSEISEGKPNPPAFQPTVRASYEVHIEGYGSGKVTLLAA